MKYAILSAAIFGSAAAKYGVEKNLDKIRSLSHSAHWYGKIGRCQGDCDNDSQCQPGLKCKERNWGKDKTITGCEGTAIRNWDYCYEPVSSHSTTLRHYTHSAQKYGKIGQCKGDCDSDAQCVKGLVCKQRHSWDSTTITGCNGVAKSNWDYCYKPVAAHKDSKELTTHGVDAHLIASVKKHGFGMCQGDCDNDSQCRGAMKCYHSSRNMVSLKIQTGCDGRTSGYHDYCYMPKATKAPTQKPTRKPTLKLSDPKRCQEWGCTEWCTYFDQATEDAGVYKTNGCGEDGMDTCACK